MTKVFKSRPDDVDLLFGLCSDSPTQKGHTAPKSNCQSGLTYKEVQVKNLYRDNYRFKPVC